MMRKMIFLIGTCILLWTAEAKAYTVTTTGPNAYCPQPLISMTSDPAPLLTEIAAMQPGGDTLINQGLVWGWNMLSPRWASQWAAMGATHAPMAYGTPNMTKVIVLLTDGQNTIDNSAHGAYWKLSDDLLGTTNATTAVTTLNTRTLAVCNGMKANGIYIYTIALGTDSPASSLALLQSCATANNYYFNAPSTSQLTSIFSTIADSLSNLRVSK